MKAYSIDFRQKIVDTYYNEPISQRQLAKRFNVAKSFIQKLLKQYRETKDIKPKPHGGGGELKLIPEYQVILLEIVEENNDATLEELCRLLQEKTGITISRATMGRMIQLLRLTCKKKTLHPSEKETERVQNLRTEFREQIRDVNPENLIFIDEAGSNLAMIRLYARSLIGTRARGSKPHQRGKNVSIIGAISMKEIITSVNILGSANKIIFEAFIANKLVPKLWDGAYVIMDNCTIHKNKEIEELIEEAGAKVMYLPPYSPDFSPIENCWSKVKTILRTIGARTYQELAKAIEQAFNQVTKKDLRNWFAHG